jgi:hypothetical protein
MDANDFLHELHFKIDEMLCDAEAEQSGMRHRSDLEELIDMVEERLRVHGAHLETEQACIDEIEQLACSPDPYEGDAGDETKDDAPADDPAALPQADGDPALLGPGALGIVRFPSARDIDSLAMELMLVQTAEASVSDPTQKFLYRSQRCEAQRRAQEMVVCFGRSHGDVCTLLGEMYAISIPLAHPHAVFVSLQELKQV